ncbi:isoflavone reductase IRL [Podospora australis]|uniref:Isoflavone reductase IRL n=1 Tax=Podospora australis TaxID=1536484 RepID=A0AAN6WXM1_9PEZI|nr:isoflavone reductase IRL [Podospora australis]
MSAATKRIVVFGGNGFLGSRICKSAVARNWDVTSVSRSGTPSWPTVTSTPHPPAWSTSVSWERADIFKPAQWIPLLSNADYVVHSLGILLEADYKGLVSGRENPLTALSKVFGANSAHQTPNPLDRKPGDRQEVVGGKQQLTYEMMNRDSAILLAKESEAAGVKGFGFISAAAGAPILPGRYITTKREAEEVIAREFPQMRGVFFRPPFMWDSGRAMTVPLAAGAAAASTLNKATGGIFGGFLGAAAIKPLKADLVADAVVEGLADERVKGPVEVEELERLGTKGWRGNMA